MRISQGYTLLELLVTLAVAGILMTFVVPSFRGLIENNNVATASNEVLGALLFARSEAVRTETVVTFTPEADGWLVTTQGGQDVVDQTVDNENISIVENIADNEVAYNSFGRADITVGDSIEINFDGTVRSRVCLSLTGRPYIKSVNEGNCP